MEKASRLSEADRVAILAAYATAKGEEDAQAAVKKLVQTIAGDVTAAVAKVKTASRSTTLSKEEKAIISGEAAKQQKRYLALKEQVKMDDDKKQAAIELA